MHEAPPVGPGDDAALLAPGDGRIIATDTMVEGVHFRTEWSTWSDVGWKLLAVNASDIFAMGAQPRAALLSLALPERWTIANGESFAEGMREAADEFSPGLRLAGGDLVQTPGVAVLTMTLVGEQRGMLQTRCGARPGMELWADGEFGWAAAGLALLREEVAVHGRTAWIERALAAHRRPVPSPIPPLSEPGGAIDISDGLVSDLMHMARASSVCLELGETIPGCGALARGGISHEQVRRWQLYGGDDYVRVVAAHEAPGGDFVRIGEVVAGSADVVQAGESLGQSGRGYEHFRGGA